MRRAVTLALLAGGLLVVVIGGALYAIDRYVQSPAFREAVLAAARQALGADVEIGAMQVSILRGVTLERVAVQNPGKLPGHLLTAEGLVLRYRLWPLLRRRLELDEATLDHPSLHLRREANGQWNIERLGRVPAPGSPAPAPAPAPAAGGAIGGGSPAPIVAAALALDLPALRVIKGETTLEGEAGQRLLGVRELDLETALRFADATLTGHGQVRVGELRLGPRLLIRDLQAPLALDAGELSLSPLQGALAGGTLGGEARLRLDREPRYRVHLTIRDADVERLIADGGSRRRLLRGRLRAETDLAGTGGPPAATGQGWAEIRDGALLDLPVLQLAGAMLQVPALRDLRFREARVEFLLEGHVVKTTLVRLTAPDLAITGQGTVTLPAGILDHQLKLAVSRSIHARIPREARGAFTEQPDGTLAMAFRVWGPYDAPRTDITSRLFRSPAEDLLRRGLRQLIR